MTIVIVGAAIYQEAQGNKDLYEVNMLNNETGITEKWFVSTKALKELEDLQRKYDEAHPTEM